jgi:hypothetical protein
VKKIRLYFEIKTVPSLEAVLVATELGTLRFNECFCTLALRFPKPAHILYICH